MTVVECWLMIDGRCGFLISRERAQKTRRTCDGVYNNEFRTDNELLGDGDFTTEDSEAQRFNDLRPFFVSATNGGASSLTTNNLTTVFIATNEWKATNFPGTRN